MLRKVTAAAIAMSLAGGVYLAGQPAEASNMGFKLERSFDLLRDAGNRPFPNVYWVAFPLFNGLGDIADGSTTDAFSNNCVGEANGPATPDGAITVSDALCDLWTSRTGGMQMQFYSQTSCSPVPMTAAVGLGGRITFSGTDFPMTADIGYEVIVPAHPTLSPTNRAVIVGSHDPSHTGHRLVFSTTCGPLAFRRDLINLPYHTMYTNAVEIHCGLEGVAWIDDGLALGGGPGDSTAVAGDGLPDHASECTQGIFDGQPGATHGIQVETFYNEPGRPAGPSPLTATINPLNGRLGMSGDNFALRPGDAYRVTMTIGHLGTTFLSPHF